MNPKSSNIIEQLQAVFDRLKRSLVIVETGTIRRTEPEYERGDGHSTRYIAEWIRDISNRSKFYSIDLETIIAFKYISEMQLSDRVYFHSGYSTDKLQLFEFIDFCYLDSANDAENTLQEFLIAWPKITPGGCIMVDDCNEASTELHKGDKLMPYLRQNNIPYKQLDTNQLIILK